MFYGSSRDFGFLPSSVNGDVQVFLGNNNAITQWQQWVKPSGVTMVYMILIAGGGGGGGGFSRASAAAGGGGGSGACSGIVTALYPAIFLPDVLKVSVGAGGLGGAAGQAGGNGTNSYVATGVGLTAGSSIPNIILESGANAPGGGGAGTGAAAGAAGSVPTIATTARNGAMGVFGTHKFTVGLVGVIGGAQTGAVGTSITAGWNIIPLTPGASGAGVNTASTGFAGGSISLQAAMDLPDGSISPASNIIAGGTAGSASAAGNGNPGLQYFKPFLMTGGSGGGSSDGSTGGNGGKGGIGCGGGGGGAGVTAGRGGDGGNGMVAIISW